MSDGASATARALVQGGSTNPAGLEGLPAPGVRAKPPVKATAQPVGPSRYNAELAAHREQLQTAIRGHGVPQQRSSDVRYWAGAAVSLPSQVVLTTARALESVAEQALASSRTAPKGIRWLAVALSSLFVGVTKLAGFVATVLDLPARGVRALLRKEPMRDVAKGQETHLRVPPDAWPELPTNAATNEEVRRYVKSQERERYEHDLILVPGFSTDDQSEALGAEAKRRLDQAAADFTAGKAPFVMVSGGNSHPQGTEFNEGFEMRRYLIEKHGIPAERIIVEPHADHSTTNLRNAGRYMERMGLRRALVTTSPTPFSGQSFYFQSADSPTYGLHMRSTFELGYRLGELTRVDRWHTTYVPESSVNLVTLESGKAPPQDP